MWGPVMWGPIMWGPVMWGPIMIACRCLNPPCVILTQGVSLDSLDWSPRVLPAVRAFVQRCKPASAARSAKASVQGAMAGREKSDAPVHERLLALMDAFHGRSKVRYKALIGPLILTWFVCCSCCLPTLGRRLHSSLRGHVSAHRTPPPSAHRSVTRRYPRQSSRSSISSLRSSLRPRSRNSTRRNSTRVAPYQRRSLRGQPAPPWVAPRPSRLM